MSNWNISGDKLVFQEMPDSSIIWVVKLFKTESPALFKFELPPQVVTDRVNSEWDGEKFVIPDESKQDRNPFGNDFKGSLNRSQMSNPLENSQYS